MPLVVNCSGIWYIEKCKTCYPHRPLSFVRRIRLWSLRGERKLMKRRITNIRRVSSYASGTDGVGGKRGGARLINYERSRSLRRLFPESYDLWSSPSSSCRSNSRWIGFYHSREDTSPCSPRASSKPKLIIFRKTIANRLEALIMRRTFTMRWAGERESRRDLRPRQ